MTPWRRAVAVACLLGCGSAVHERDDAGGAMDAGTPAPHDAGFDSGPARTPAGAFLDAYDRLRCELAVRCARPDGFAQPTEADCHPAIETPWARGAREAVAAGRIVFDDLAAAECLASLETQLADCTWDPLEGDELLACDRAFRGNVRDGETCVRDFPPECMEGRWCARDDRTQPGVCEPYRVPGDPCATYLACGFPDGWCFDDVCISVGAVGVSCASDLECQRELICLDGSCTEPYEGAPCTGYACGRDLQCVDSMCVAGLPEGSACGASMPVGCAAGTACWGDPRRCTSTAGHAEGHVCYAIEGSIGDSCRDALVCRVELTHLFYGQGTCVVGQPVGLPCDETRVCAKGARCVGGRCTRVVTPREPCGPDAACPLGFRCERGACEPLPAPAQRCTPEVGCLQGLCVGGVCCLAPEHTPCTDASAPLGACESACVPSDGACGYPAECDVACDGQSCWWTRDHCVPRCPP